MVKTQKFKKTSNIKSSSATTQVGVGNVVTLKITALGPNNVGINEFSYAMPILVPSAKLGDTVQVQILKLTKYNVAIAKLVKVLSSSQTSATRKQGNQKQAAVITNQLKAGDTVEGTVVKFGKNATGVVELTSDSPVKKVFVHCDETVKLQDKVNITITRVKATYAFGVFTNLTSAEVGIVKNNGRTAKTQGNDTNLDNLQAFKGTKFTLVLPKKSLKHRLTNVNTKRPLKHLVFKLDNPYKTTNLRLSGNSATDRGAMVNSLESLINKKPSNLNFKKVGGGSLPSNTILFVKPNLGAKSGNKVQIKITKFVPATKQMKYNVAIAKIVKLNPVSSAHKKALVRASIRQMLKSGMHYGEKAIKCNARMKNYVWIRKKGQNINKPLIKKGRNIINLLKTRRCLNKALAQLSKYAVKGKTFLFVGTKKAAAGLVARASLFSKKAFFVNTRWLGGMLTNWKTIVKSISKIRPILKEKQIIIKDILEKRQTIKARLIQKAILLRKKSKLMLSKGRQLISLLKANKGSNLKTANVLNAKRKELISKGILALEKRQQLVLKRQELISQSQKTNQIAKSLTLTFGQLLNQLLVARKKLRELKSLLLISRELQAFKQANQGNLYTVSYNKFRSLNAPFVLSNPPREILNKMVAMIKAAERPVSENQGKANLNLKDSSEKASILMLSQLLSKFTLFVPTIKTSIKNLQNNIRGVLTSLTKVKTLLNTVKTKLATYLTLKNKIVVECRQIKQTLQTERSIIRILKRKLKQIASQKRLINFLPKLRYLPTPTNKIEQTARFLMKKFVDPKMKYSMDAIYDEKLNRKGVVAASRKKKWQRLEKYLGGISNMTKIKEQHIRNNVAIIIGQQEEMNAVRECQKLGIKMFHIVDTNCNPGLADHFIPANDDARNSIKYILAKFLTRIRLAQKLKNKFKKKATLV